MGVMVSNDNNRNTELNRRIDTDLRARVQRGGAGSYDENHDVEEEYATETKKTGRFTWVWIILIVLAIISAICIVFI